MRTPLLKLFVALVAVLCLYSGRAFAQADYVGTRAQGMGEALRANAAGASAILLNPSGMSLSRGYVIEAAYGLNIEELGHHAFVAIVDSVTSRIAAGLYYEYIHANPKLGFDWAGGRVENAKLSRGGHSAGISLSMALGDHFLLGASLKYLHMSTTAPLPSGTFPAKLSLPNTGINGVTFDVGLTVKVIPKLQLAVTGMNLWNHGSVETPTTAGFGLSFIPLPSLLINFDGTANFSGYKTLVLTDDPSVVKYKFKVGGRFGPGIEWLIANKVPLRAGFIYDTGLSAAYVTAGTGYFGTSWALDVSYRAKVTGGVENYLMVGLRIFVN